MPKLFGEEFSSGLNKISYYILAAGLFLLPLFFWSWPGVYGDASKKFFLAFIVIASLVFWGFSKLKEGEVSLPKNLISFGVLSVLTVTLLSALFSGSIGYSLFGVGLESGTFVSVTIFFALLFLCSQFYGSKNRFLVFYLEIFVIYLVVALFQFVHIFTNIIPAGYLGGKSLTLIGKLSDFGIFSGFIVISSIILLDLIIAKGVKLFRYAIWFVAILGLGFLAIANFYEVWVVLCLAALAVYILIFCSAKRYSEKRKYWGSSLLVFLISLVFVLFAGQGVGSHLNILGKSTLGGAINVLDQKLGVSYTEIRPNFKSTVAVGWDTFKEHPLLGVGANNYNAVWAKYKPQAFNLTPYWNNDFQYGFGLFPTLVTESGMLGKIAWIFFLGSLIFYGYLAWKKLRQKKDRVSDMFFWFSAISVLYFLVFFVISVPETTILALCFAMIGVFVAQIGSLLPERVGKNILIQTKDSRSVNYFAAGTVAVILITSTYLCLDLLSLLQFSRGYALAAETGNPVLSEIYTRRALSLMEKDVYYRNLMDVDVLKIESLLNQSGMDKQTIQGKFQGFFTEATNAATKMIEANPNNYQNYISRAMLYEKLTELGVLGAYTSAKNDLLMAQELNPHTPVIYYDLALVELASKDSDTAEMDVSKSLAEKKDYVDAILLGAQINLLNGKMDTALADLKKAKELAPRDPMVLFQLGYLQYQAGDYDGALGSLKTLTAIHPGLANAEYFVGLAYDRLGNKTAALQVFRALALANPANTEVAGFVKNLEAGRSALVGQTKKAKK